MKLNGIKTWKIIAKVGLAISIISLTISSLQYFQFRINEPFVPSKYVPVFINTVLFIGFIYLNFNPMNFRIYSGIFYIYGLGNLVDHGNVLAVTCLFVSALCLYFTGFFDEKKILKAVLLLIPAIICFALQVWEVKFIYSMISLMHIVGYILLMEIAYILIRPYLNLDSDEQKIKYLNSKTYTAQDMDWLTKVAAGYKYIEIAKEANVSESKVKAKMLELYTRLGAIDRVDFLSKYRNYRFEKMAGSLELEENPTSEEKQSLL